MVTAFRVFLRFRSSYLEPLFDVRFGGGLTFEVQIVGFDFENGVSKEPQIFSQHSRFTPLEGCAQVSGVD